VSDERLRELERIWASSDATPEVAAAYLHELLRAGEVTRTECALAWRISRLEGQANGSIERGQTRFDPSRPTMAEAILSVLFGNDPPLAAPPPGPMASTGAIGDVVRSVLMDEGVIQNPLAPGPPGFMPVMNPPQRRCRPTRHLGPVDYDQGDPVCERCGSVLAYAPRGRSGVDLVGCTPDRHLGPPSYDDGPGPVCNACGNGITTEEYNRLSEVLSG
jgi:hypothetical protein